MATPVGAVIVEDDATGILVTDVGLGQPPVDAQGIEMQPAEDAAVDNELFVETARVDASWMDAKRARRMRLRWHKRLRAAEGLSQLIELTRQLTMAQRQGGGFREDTARWICEVIAERKDIDALAAAVLPHVVVDPEDGIPESIAHGIYIYIYICVP